MPLFIKIVFLSLATMGIVRSLMLVAPLKYLKLLTGFLNERVMRRQTTERDKALAIRMQGLVAVAAGALFALFVWALA
ncbi:MAG TPA: hypothetical protein VFF95_06785 [Candidatus Binatus sp.]|nr:hypothetical protein [Candidatus Binatus sp.]